MKWTFNTLKFRTKLIAMLLILFVTNVILMVFVAMNVGKENSLNRMNIEFREEARTMATVWLYRSGGAFLMESGIPMTADGQLLEQNIVSYFERWASLNSTKNIMTVIMQDERGWKRICSSATDKEGKSLKGTYIDDPRILEALERPNEVEYTGDETVGGKDYIISYSFFYKADDTGEIPFALAIGEDLADAFKEINMILIKHLLIAMAINIVAFVLIFLLIMSFVKNDITKRVLDTTNALKGTSEQVAIKAEQFSRAGNYISMDSKRQIETIEEVTNKFAEFGEIYEKNYDEISMNVKLVDNLVKLVEKGDTEASSMMSRINSAKTYINESDEVISKLRELRSQAVSEELKYNIDKIVDIAETVETKLNDGSQNCSIVAGVLKSLLLDVNTMKIGTYNVKNTTEIEIGLIKSLEGHLIKLQDSTNEQNEKAQENIQTGSSLKSELANVASVIDDLKKI